MKRVLIIGGYGNFGSFISRSLANEEDLRLIIAGRSPIKAQTLSEELGAEYAAIDIHNNFFDRLKEIKPDIVIHTSGPFQSQNYQVAKACIEFGAHYIDLADARDFVANITSLNDEAQKADVLLVSGASSVPCLTSALIDLYCEEFDRLEHLDYGITTAQKTTRGLATTAAILSYTGKPFTTLIDAKPEVIYGWQDIHSRKYQGLGRRLLGNCNVPDLELFPKRYPDLKNLRFYAGLELPFIHATLWALSWLVRANWVKGLEPIAPLLLKLSFLFDIFGSDKSAFHMNLCGLDKDGNNKSVYFELTARSGDGPFIPCIPAILITKKLARGELNSRGATPCIGIITKDEYLDALSNLDISWSERREM